MLCCPCCAACRRNGELPVRTVEWSPATDICFGLCWTLGSFRFRTLLSLVSSDQTVSPSVPETRRSESEPNLRGGASYHTIYSGRIERGEDESRRTRDRPNHANPSKVFLRPDSSIRETSKTKSIASVRWWWPWQLQQGQRFFVLWPPRWPERRLAFQRALALLDSLHLLVPRRRQPTQGAHKLITRKFPVVPSGTEWHRAIVAFNKAASSAAFFLVFGSFAFTYFIVNPALDRIHASMEAERVAWVTMREEMKKINERHRAILFPNKESQIEATEVSEDITGMFGWD